MSAGVVKLSVASATKQLKTKKGLKKFLQSRCQTLKLATAVAKNHSKRPRFLLNLG